MDNYSYPYGNQIKKTFIGVGETVASMAFEGVS